jgi:FKBP-type peptidyl-prolyl cis-trans isomerase
MKKSILVIVAALTATSGFTQALKTHKDSVSYALGVSMAESLKKSGMTEIDEAIFNRAVSEHLKGKATMDAMAADKLYKEESKKQNDLKAEASKKAGETYLKTNAGKPGVKTTASGLQYKTTVEGTGMAPDANDKVTVHYHGTLIDGTVFDSSVDRGQPATFGLNQVITGWTEGLQLMKEGGKTTFYIPSNLAYGARAQGKIAANSTLIFDVELIKVEPVEGSAAPEQGKPQVKPSTTPTATPAPATKPADKKEEPKKK